jgi:16S rRNA (adenine1518-N6/adenine1519-N6)-dimethyltransferase
MKKKFGQNFLIDKNIAKRELEYAEIKKNDVVLEIGPGNGILTKLLAEKAKQVIAIEIDDQLVSNLRKILPDNVLLIHEDALKVNYQELPSFNKIVSNLPFQISSPITFKLLELDFNLALLIYQKEFANRMVANPGNKHYSRLSVGVYYKAKCEIIENISKSCFHPKPLVDASVVKLIPLKSPPFPVLNERFFFDITRELFNHRRKIIKNTLEGIFDNINLRNVPYVNSRVETLSPEKISELCNILYVFLILLT